MFFPYKTTPVLASMTIPASESMEMSAGQSVEASACIGAASRDSKSVPIKNKDNLLPVLPAIFVFKSGVAGWLELPGELPPPEFLEFSIINYLNTFFMEAKKSKKAAIENQRGSWLLMGLVVALAFMFVSFEWTQHDVRVAALSPDDESIFVTELVPITFPDEKLEPPPPPETKVTELFEIVENNMEVTRSEERRVGKECRSRWSPYH